MENPVFINDVVNIGNDETYTILDLAKLIIQLTRSDSRIINMPSLPEGDMTRRQPDISNMEKLLNRGFIPLETGLKEIILGRNPVQR